MSHRRRTWPLVVGALLLAIWGDYELYPRWASVGDVCADVGRNGLWLRYPWYFGEHTDSEVRALADQLHRDRIRYAYFHVRHINPRGALAFRYPEEARRLLATMRERAPGVRCIAWVYAGNARGKGEVDLASAAVRLAMVREAVWLCEECGFDGVQWDYEVCPDGDGAFLALMARTREALPQGKLLACAAPAWAPQPFTRRWGWSAEYYSLVAATCDQIAVMCYDTDICYPRAYVAFLRRQPRRILPAVGQGNPDCRVLLGVPTYEGYSLTHPAHSEQLRLAVKRIREGLSGASNVGASEGIALFADYTTSPTEWAVYRENWLR